MTLDWLKSFQAKVGVEGRNVIVVAGLFFLAFAFWLVLRTYVEHPVVSIVLGSVLLAFGMATISIGLLAKPQPSDVTSRYLFQQVGKQLIYAGGMQSKEEVVSLLREAHNIKELPAPAALIRGAAADPTSYESLSPQDAASIIQRDREGVARMLDVEALRILSATTQSPTQAIRQTKPSPPLPPTESSPKQ